MTDTHFQTQMARLIDTFGANYYRRERNEVIWREMKQVPDTVFTTIVDRLIADCRQAPLAAEFREHLSRYRDSLPRTSQRAQEGDNSCEHCSGNGVYLCRRREHAGMWAFRCHCHRGLNDPRAAIPYFTQEHAAEFFHYQPGSHV